MVMVNRGEATKRARHSQRVTDDFNVQERTTHKLFSAFFLRWVFRLSTYLLKESSTVRKSTSKIQSHAVLNMLHPAPCSTRVTFDVSKPDRYSSVRFGMNLGAGSSCRAVAEQFALNCSPGNCGRSSRRRPMSFRLFMCCWEKIRGKVATWSRRQKSDIRDSTYLYTVDHADCNQEIHRVAWYLQQRQNFDTNSILWRSHRQKPLD